MKRSLKIFAIAFFYIQSLYGFDSFAQKENSTAWSDLRYEDLHTFKTKKTYRKDPWTWGYSSKFAERFRLPTQWIEPEIKGILAVAFRIKDLNQEGQACGIGGKEDKCWPNMTCQFEIYYENQINLPWIDGSPDRDNFDWDMSSRSFLGREAISGWIERYGKGDLGSNLVYQQPINIGLSDSMGQYHESKRKIFFYEKRLLPDIGLISFEAGHGCPAYQFQEGALSIYFFDSYENQKKTKGVSIDRLKSMGLAYVAVLPAGYVKRINLAAKIGQTTNDEIINRSILDFKNK